MRNLYPEQERERRFRIIEAGVHEEFWKITSDSLNYWCSVKRQEVIELLQEGLKDEAARLSIEVTAVERVAREPYIIIKANKTLFDKFVSEICNVCGHVTKKLKKLAN